MICKNIWRKNSREWILRSRVPGSWSRNSKAIMIRVGWEEGQCWVFNTIRLASFLHPPSHTLFMLMLNSQCHPYFLPTDYESEVPMTLSIASVNLIELHTELKKPHLYFRINFTIKDYNSETAGCKRQMHKVR